MTETGRPEPTVGALNVLQDVVDRAQAAAEAMGLAPFAVEFELVPETAIYELASYGMPGHWRHWTLGRDFERFRQRLGRGYGRLYEMVVNTDPARAFLLESNSLAAQKAVICHVFGHADIFRNHSAFADTPRDMDWRLAAARERFQEYEGRFGLDRVEETLDAALSLADQVEVPGPARPPASAASAYRDLLTASPAPPPASPMGERPGAATLPTGDLLGFMARYSPVLADWQRDILEVVRQEALYLRPQRRTKVLNEGWATLVQQQLLDRLPLTAGEAVEAARLHAMVTAPDPVQINPYALGYGLVRWLVGRHGWAAVRQLLMQETDASLVRNWVEEEAVRALGLYRYRWRRGQIGSPLGPLPALEAVVEEMPWQAVRDELANRLAYEGPRVTAQAVDPHGRLCLGQQPDGRALDEHWAQATLNQAHRLWGAPVLLERPDQPPLVSTTAPWQRQPELAGR